MKKTIYGFLTLTTLILVANSFATNLHANTLEDFSEINQGEIGMTFIAKAEILKIENIQPNCLPNELCPSPASKITIQFSLNGCADRLGPVAYRSGYNHQTGKTDIYLSAINVQHEMSLRATCRKMPQPTKVIYARSFFEKEDLNLKMLY